MINLEANIETYCAIINNLRLKGGCYTAQELSAVLKGIPYATVFPVIMRRNPDISGYTVYETGIEFDTKHSIYKDAMLKLLTEARQYASDCSRRMRIEHKKTDFITLIKELCGDFIISPVTLHNAVNDACVKLHYQGKSDQVPSMLKFYNTYLKNC